MSGAQTAQQPWLTVVGCLPGGALAPTAPANVLEAPAVFGAKRLLMAAKVTEDRQNPWPSPFSAGIDAVLARRGNATTVLASGDPLNHGVASTLLRHVPAAEMTVHPAPSAFALAAAAMRWPLQEVTCISLHTEADEAVLGYAAPGRRILALTKGSDSPAACAHVLTAHGYGASRINVLEALGGPAEARHEARADTLNGTFDPLNTLAIECVRAGPVTAATLDHDGCITRDEVRLLTIAALGHGRGHLWDVGAGSGAVAIDHMRAGGTATLFERSADRVGAIHRNLQTASVAAPVFEGEAAEHFVAASTPDAVFMGGSVGDEALFEAAWARLAKGGIFVSNAVTLEGEATTLARFKAHGGTLTRISLSFGGAVGRLSTLRPAMPVLQWRVVKG